MKERIQQWNCDLRAEGAGTDYETWGREHRVGGKDILPGYVEELRWPDLARLTGSVRTYWYVNAMKRPGGHAFGIALVQTPCKVVFVEGVSDIVPYVQIDIGSADDQSLKKLAVMLVAINDIDQSIGYGPYTTALRGRNTGDSGGVAYGFTLVGNPEGWSPVYGMGAPIHVTRIADRLQVSVFAIRAGSGGKIVRHEVIVHGSSDTKVETYPTAYRVVDGKIEKDGELEIIR